MSDMTSRSEQRIVVIGGDGPLLEGVSDLLQLAGYQVRIESRQEMPAGLYASASAAPNLTILDISGSGYGSERLSSLLDLVARSRDAQILVVSFAGDDRIRDLEQSTRTDHRGRLHFYAHSLLGAEGLLEKVDSCFG